MSEYIVPGIRKDRTTESCALTAEERVWAAQRFEDLKVIGAYCEHCEYHSNNECSCPDDVHCPTSESIESLNDGVDFIKIMLEDMVAGEEHDMPCSHLPEWLSCPYKSDENGNTPCVWCNHKELLIRTEEAMDGNR